ncbi:hypothetical protein V2J09_020560 [Rumex salicifolius]
MAGFKAFLKKTTRKQKPSIPGSVNGSSHGGRTPPSISRTVSSCIRQQQVEELEHVFNKFDVNGDGRISSSELRSIMSNLGQTVSDDEILAMIREVDSDGDGFIDLREFIELNTKGVDSDEIMVNLREAFSVYDIDGNGSISAEELLQIMKSLGDGCSIADCRKMIAGVDTDGDESKKIVVSRDVVFEEDEKWNWDSSYKELIDSELEWEPELDAVEETKGGSNEDDVPSSPGMPHLAANLSSSVASPGSGNSSVPTAATTDRNSVPAAATTGRERRVPAWMQDYPARSVRTTTLSPAAAARCRLVLVHGGLSTCHLAELPPP